MAKDPAFLFYSSDFMVGTALMNFNQKGKYITLMCLQHQIGHLSEEDMLKICGTYEKDIFRKFTKDAQGLFFNERLEEEINKRGKFCNSRRNNRLGNKDENTSSTLDGHTSVHMSNTSSTLDEHMENENNSNNKSSNKGRLNKINVNKHNNTKTDDVEHMSNISSTHDNHMSNEIGFYPIEHLLEVYFTSNTLIRTREQVAMANHMDMSVLRDWGEAFNRFLLMEGTMKKIKADWPKHFKNWLAKLDKNQNPNNLFNENSKENGKPESKPSNGTGNIKGHQPIDMESVKRKVDFMFGKDGDS